jgi:hypothetical protein
LDEIPGRTYRKRLSKGFFGRKRRRKERREGKRKIKGKRER